MGSSEVESWRVDAPTRPCAFCRQNVEGDRCTFCPRCEAVYHPDCWVSNSRRCAVYGCEPGLKPAMVPRRVRPVLEPPPLPRSAVNWTWLTPFAVVFLVQLARLGMNSTEPPAPPPPQILRQGLSTDRESRMDSLEPVIPPLPQEVPALLQEAIGLEKSVSDLTSKPTGRLTDDVRTKLRETVTADLAALQRALKIYRRCAAARPDEAFRTRIERIQWFISRKRTLLFDL